MPLPVPAHALAAARRAFQPTPEQQDALDAAVAAAWAAAHPPTCCRACRTRWETQAAADGAPFAQIVARRMMVCDACGDKRCQRVDDHTFVCTAE